MSESTEKAIEKKVYTFPQKVRAVTRHIQKYRSQLMVISALGVVSALANGTVPLLVGRFLDALIKPKDFVLMGFPPVSSITLFLGLWILIQLFANGTDWVMGRINRQLGTNIQAQFVIDAYSHMLTLPVSFFKDRKSGELSQLISRTSWMLDTIISGIVVGLTPQFLSIFVGLGIAFYLNTQLAFILVAGVLLYVVSISFILKPMAGFQLETNKKWNEAYGTIHDAYTNLQTVKNAGAESFESNRAHDAYFGVGGAANIWNKLELSWNNINGFQRILVILTQLAIFGISIHQVTNGSLSIGELISFNAYASMVFGPFVSLGGQWQSLQNGLTSAAQMEEIFSAEPEQYDPQNAVSIEPVKGKVAFKNVHFGYGEGKQDVLKDLSFTAEAGEVIALVGETGAGKSTTAELISGYYFPSSGSVEIDGFDIKNISLRELRKNIAIVPQEVVLFNSNILDNIRYGRPEASDAEVEEAAKKARADAFINEFPDKYKQLVGERGIKLSVGQKQRIAIARAIVRDPKILILDEPTSALDAETESYITKSLEELMQGRTTFIIAHRLSTVRKADKILVLKDGQIAEQGSHEELVKKENGVYRHLHDLHIGLRD